MRIRIIAEYVDFLALKPSGYKCQIYTGMLGTPFFILHATKTERIEILKKCSGAVVSTVVSMIYSVVDIKEMEGVLMSIKRHNKVAI